MVPVSYHFSLCLSHPNDRTQNEFPTRDRNLGISSIHLRGLTSNSMLCLKQQNLVKCSQNSPRISGRILIVMFSNTHLADGTISAQSNFFLYYFDLALTSPLFSVAISDRC